MPQAASIGRGGWGSPFRWILIGVLAMLGVGAVVEARARSQAAQAFQQVQDILDSRPGLDPEAVHRHLGIEPVNAYRTDDKLWIEVYRWDGVLQPYTVYVTYRIGATKLLLSVRSD